MGQVRVVALRIAVVLAIVFAITWFCFHVVRVNSTTVGFAYLVAILLIAARWGLVESVTGSVAAVLCLNYYFLPPIGTFTVADAQNWVALFAFLATSITASQLSTRARARTFEALARQQEMEKLYALSRSILLMNPSHPVGKQLAMHVAQNLGAPASALYDRSSGELYRSGPEDFPDSNGQLRQSADEGTSFRDDAAHTIVTSIRLGGEPIGSLGLRGVPLSDSALQSLANLVAIGLERAHAFDAANRAEAARQSDELKSMLLDALAHEFKTPLTSIKAASTALLSTISLNSAQQREMLTIVDEETDRLSVLVTEAIQMARIEAGRVHLRRENHAVDELLHSILDKPRPMAINLDIAPGLPAVWVDKEMVELALRQVVDNASKYSPHDKPISIAADLDGERVIVSVRDSGPGIPEAEQSRIFEKFYRGTATRENMPGEGLGLMIAREIVHAHGGEIWVESKLGEGSIFRFSIPTAKTVTAP